jgi:hypothetical protein
MKQDAGERCTVMSFEVDTPKRISLGLRNVGEPHRQDMYYPQEA